MTGVKSKSTTKQMGSNKSILKAKAHISDFISSMVLATTSPTRPLAPDFALAFALAFDLALGSAVVGAVEASAVVVPAQNGGCMIYGPDGCMDGWMDGQIYIYINMYIFIYIYIHIYRVRCILKQIIIYIYVCTTCGYLKFEQQHNIAIHIHMKYILHIYIYIHVYRGLEILLMGLFNFEKCKHAVLQLVPALTASFAPSCLKARHIAVSGPLGHSS